MLPDDLSREVYSVLGVPIDAIGMDSIPYRIEAAARSAAPFLISTANINFLVSSRSDPDFRESLLQSDLCTADGVPVVWIARLMRLPIRERVAGSDIFETLKRWTHFARPLNVYLFGGAEGVAAAAADALNARDGGLRCVGSMCPGFGSVSELSSEPILGAINSSGADFLAVSLGAKKGQEWLQRNHHRLRVPVRVHLGATINFEAARVKRAPVTIRKLGLEWLWRIKEEPHLWRRYWHDGGVLLRLLLTHVLPLTLAVRPLRHMTATASLTTEHVQTQNGSVIGLTGDATAEHIDVAIECFRKALAQSAHVVIDVTKTRFIDARFFGLMLMLRKQLMARGGALSCTGASRSIKKMFRLNGVEYLLAPGP